MKIDKKYNVLIMTRTKIRIYDKQTRRQKDVLMERIDDKFDKRHRHSDRKNREVLLALATALDNDYELVYDVDEDADRMHGNKNILIKKGNLDIEASIDYAQQGPRHMRLYIFKPIFPNVYIKPVKIKDLNTTSEAFREIMKYIDDHNNTAAENNLQNNNNISANLDVNNHN